MRQRTLTTFLLVGFLVLNAGTSVRAEEPKILIDKATATVNAILGDSNYAIAKKYLARAKGVLVIPGLVKAGFIIGGEAGEGALLSRNDKGKWSGPAFYLLVAGSIGWQIGVESKEMVLIVMTEKGLNSLMSNQIKVGADVSVTAGTIGGGAAASTVGSVGADFIAFSKSKGLFGGGALDGALIKTVPDSNESYYGTAASPKQILIERKFDNPHADTLRQALSQ